MINPEERWQTDEARSRRTQSIAHATINKPPQQTMFAD